MYRNDLILYTTYHILLNDSIKHVHIQWLPTSNKLYMIKTKIQFIKMDEHLWIDENFEFLGRLVWPTWYNRLNLRYDHTSIYVVYLIAYLTRVNWIICIWIAPIIFVCNELWNLNCLNCCDVAKFVFQFIDSLWAKNLLT